MAGYSYNEIARLEDLTKPAVGRIIKRAKENTSQDQFSNKKRTGRPSKLTPMINKSHPWCSMGRISMDLIILWRTCYGPEYT